MIALKRAFGRKIVTRLEKELIHIMGLPLLLEAIVLVGVAGPALSNSPVIKPSPYLKNQISFPDDPFRIAGTSSNEPDWIKFTILLEPYDPNIVYFQDGHEYTFHYHFATELLEPFVGMSREQFDRATLYQLGRKAVLGAVIMPPTVGYPPPPSYPEYGIQFVGQDAYSKEEIEALFKIVKASILAGPSVQAFYFPTYEQTATARANHDWFEEHNISISSAARWAEGNVCYSNGWAIGELKYVEGTGIHNAYLSGQLEPDDIVLTDGVPAEIPFVAGVISLSPSTPNSHVAILATTFCVPFIHLAVPEDADRALQLLGHKVALCSFEHEGACDIRLIDAEGVLDDATIAEILLLKKPAGLNISHTTHYGAYSAPADELLPSDIKYFGGKAANFGMLRTSVPDNSPVAVAFSFDLWNEFLDQRLSTGRTFREDIAVRLLSFIYPPSNMMELSDVLGDIRDLFRDDSATGFTQSQKDTIIGILQDPQYGFDTNKNIRFRSSTNVEDTEQFTGAGLYDSYSGCLADELDDDSRGPCICDPENSSERGVFRAIRKVFASFYSDNAFIERLRHGIVENDVGMALLVHHSFPDEIELANGVATLQRSHPATWDIRLVTQDGAMSVANPEPGCIPEEVTVKVYSFGAFPALVRQSNLVPLGAYVMQWQQDYIDLSNLLVKVGKRFSEVTGESNFLLEMEYKKVSPDGRLVIKQVREIPQPDTTQTITPFLINEPAQYCAFQGEFGDVFANHRLKSRWQFETRSCWLTETSMADSLYTKVDFEYLADGRVCTLTGRPCDWPMAGYSFNGTDATDIWLMHDLANPRTCKLYTRGVPLFVSQADNPLLTLSDFEALELEVEYKYPVLSWNYEGPNTTTIDIIRLCQPHQPQAGDLLQERTFQGEAGILIKTSFYWPPPPAGMAAGYTAPLVGWVQTVIEGYTSEAIILRGYCSQTYRPEHHNFDEHFLFEPQLEPDLSPVVLAELRNHNIRLIHVFGGMSGTKISTYGYDNEGVVSHSFLGHRNLRPSRE